MGGTLASRLSGLLREVLMVALLPVRAADAFRIAWTLPNLFRELLAEGALTNAFIPVYQRLRGAERRDFAGAMLAVLALANALLLAAALLATPLIVDVLLAANSNVDRALAVTLVRLTFPVLMAISFSALAMGVLNAEERFLAPAWAPVALNLAAVVAMLLFPAQPAALSLGVVLGGALQALVQWPAMARAGVLPRLGALWHAAMPATLALMAPFAFTTGARQLLNVVAQRLVSNEALFPAGAVNGYAMAAMLFSLALGLFAISPAVAFYARLGRQAADGDEAGFAATLAGGVRFILLLTLPVGLAMYLFAEPAVRVLFELLPPAEGQASSIALAVAALAPLGLALAPSGLVNFLLRPFFVRGRARAPVLLSVGLSLLTGGLYLWLTPPLGIAGLSWATFIAQATLALVLLLWHARGEGLPLAATLGGALRLGLAAGLAGLLALWAADLVAVEGWLGHLSRLIVAGGVLLAVYGALAVLLRVPEAMGLARRLKLMR